MHFQGRENKVIMGTSAFNETITIINSAIKNNKPNII